MMFLSMGPVMSFHVVARWGADLGTALGTGEKRRWSREKICQCDWKLEIPWFLVVIWLRLISLEFYVMNCEAVKPHKRPAV